MTTVAPFRSLALILALTACGASRAPAQVNAPIATAADSSSDPALPPAGFGQFNQDVITLRLRSGSLEIRVVPLDERVLRLLSNDGYNSLRALVAGQQARIDSIARRAGVQEPGIALVTFFASTPNTRFDPQLLNITVRNRLLRPIGVIPLSPAMSAQQLDIRDQATGLFLMEERIPVTEPFVVGYLADRADDWDRRLGRLDAERGRIRVRAQGASGGEP
jgi:hypothetical protein